MLLRSKYFLIIVTLFLIPGCAQVAVTAATATGRAVAEERTIGDVVDDTTIWAEIKHHYVQTDVNDLLTGVSIEVNQGRVLLTGSVRKPETQVEAVRLAWLPREVKEVINEIQITNAVSVKGLAKDTWVTTQVKSRVLLNKDIRSINYTVTTVNDVVYLMGIARSETELKNVTRIASMVKGVKKVVSHVRLREPYQPELRSASIEPIE